MDGIHDLLHAQVADAERRLGDAERERDERRCVLCPDQEANDLARGYCPTHGTLMRDQADWFDEQLATVTAERDRLREEFVGAETESVEEEMSHARTKLRAEAAERRLAEATGLLRIYDMAHGPDVTGPLLSGVRAFLAAAAPSLGEPGKS